MFPLESGVGIIPALLGMMHELRLLFFSIPTRTSRPTLQLIERPSYWSCILVCGVLGHSSEVEGCRECHDGCNGPEHHDGRSGGQ